MSVISDKKSRDFQKTKYVSGQTIYQIQQVYSIEFLFFFPKSLSITLQIY